MNIRFRVSASFGSHFGAVSLATVERERVPEVGDAHNDGTDSYRVIKVLGDVEPDPGSGVRGAIVYLLKMARDPGAVAGAPASASLALLVNTSARLRECIERADIARRTGHAERYRRHVEEFLFMSNAASRSIGPRIEGAVERARRRVPYLPVYSESEAVSSLLCEGLIESRYAAQVEGVLTVAAIRSVLDRMDVSRPCVFIITEPLTLRSGLAAVHEIRTHPRAGRCPILVLAHQVSDSDETLALAAGANAYMPFPENLDRHSALAATIRGLVEPPPALQAPLSSA